MTAASHPPAIAPMLQASPLAAVLLCFVVLPLLTIGVVSFLDYDGVRILWRFVLTNYAEILTSKVTLQTYLATLRFAAMTLVITFLIGFLISYFIVFHVRSVTAKTILFMIFTVPFFTSNLIRAISWIPLLGREGLVNGSLQGAGLVSAPLEWLLYSDFSVVLAYVYLYLFFMVAPIFNSMIRIDRSLVEAAVDSGASELQVIWNVVLPLSKSGVMIGSIFVFALVMGDFVTVQIMGGGQRLSVALMIYYQLTLLQYPLACANAVLLLAIVAAFVAVAFRLVDIRKDL